MKKASTGTLSLVLEFSSVSKSIKREKKKKFTEFTQLAITQKFTSRIDLTRGIVKDWATTEMRSAEMPMKYSKVDIFLSSSFS